MQQQVFINAYPLDIEARKVSLYEIVETTPETKNRIVKFRLAANIAKRLTKTESPVFSVGAEIYATQDIHESHEEELDIEGTKVKFQIKLERREDIDLKTLEQGPERLVNKLVDWYYIATVPNSFHMENVNYIVENIFAKLESRLHSAFKINVNEGLLRATRTFNGIIYLVIDPEYRVTWEQSLWDDVKFFAKSNLNADVYLPSAQTIRAINERYGRVGTKPGRRVQGKNKLGEYEIIEFDFTKNPMTPNIVDGMSQYDFFAKVHNTPITDKKQPLVRVRVTRGYHFGKENYHVPELLEFDRIPPHIRENKRVSGALANIQKPSPRGRFAQIINFVQGDPFGRSKGFAVNEFVKRFMTVSSRPILVDAKVLDPIKVKMGEQSFSVSNDSEFLRNIFKRKFHRVPDAPNLWLVYVKEREADVFEFYQKLRQESATHGLILPEKPVCKPVESLQYSEFVKALHGADKTEIVLTFGPASDDELYEAIKQELLVKYGTLSQHISYENTIERIHEYESQGNEHGIKTILTLISMQMCAKLGGAPWAFSEPIYNKGCPIFGLEVSHLQGEDLIIAACAVFDEFGEYLFSEPSVQPIEIVAGLSQVLQNAIARYTKQFGKPSQVFIVREGLNYTQEKNFLLKKDKGELPVLESVLKQAGLENYVFVMEKKNTHLRMFKRITDVRVENPAPGTVVIGSPFERNEMVMVSHEIIQGTADPVMYKVIRPLQVEMEQVAKALYKLTRHHWNTYKAIRTPAPAFHAHEITYMVRRILKQTPRHRRVLDRPFYL